MPKAAKTLTSREVNAITKVGLTALGGADGLYLSVKDSGTRSYVYRYRVRNTGRRTMIGLGSVADISLKDARAKAMELRKIVDQGKNPAEEKRDAARRELQAQRAREAERLAELHTVEYCGRQLIEERSRAGYWNANTRGEAVAVSYLKRNIIPAIGSIPIAELTVEDVFRLVGPIWQSQRGAAPATLSLVFHIFRWAKAKGWCTGDNPADRKGSLGVLLEPLEKGRRKRENMPAVDYREIPRFVAQCLMHQGMGYLITAFSIVIAVRSKMVRLLKWSDIDEKDRTTLIPESSLKTKGRGAHTVFLSDAALDILRMVPRTEGVDYVFYSPRKKVPLSDMVFSGVFQQLHKERFEKDGIGWIDPVQSAAKGMPVVATQHGTARAGFKTWASSGENRKLFDADAVELCLAHNLKDDYGGAYNRSTLEPERRYVMEEWGKYCLGEFEKARALIPWLR